MEQGSGWNAILQYSFLRVFANDGIIDARELAMIEKLATADGVVDEHERSVLSILFGRVAAERLSPDVREEIARFKDAHGIP